MANDRGRQNEEPWSVARLLEWTGGHFAKIGIPQPRFEAELLLSHVLACRRIDLYGLLDNFVDDKHRGMFRELVKRRSNREPAAYLVGKRGFYTRDFAVGPAVLIPRPETEHIVEIALIRAKERPIGRFADIGTGSGCLAVTLACHLPAAHGVAVDISKAALAIAIANGAAAGTAVADRLRFVEGDLLEPLAGMPPFDLIVSNPPYISTAEMEALDPEVKAEPRLALAAGADGLDVIRRLIAGVGERLTPSGLFLMEIGAGQGVAVSELVERQSDLVLETVAADLAGIPRVVVVMRR